MADPVGNISGFRDARPSFARTPESGSLLPYREGKAASLFTAIGSSACTASEQCDRKGFYVLKILKEKVSMPSAKVFGEQRNGWGNESHCAGLLAVSRRVLFILLLATFAAPANAHDLHYVDRAKLGSFELTLSSWYAPNDTGAKSLWAYPKGTNADLPAAVPTKGWVRIWMSYDYSGEQGDELRLVCAVKVRRPDGKVKKYTPYLCLNQIHDGQPSMVDLRMRSRFDVGDQAGVWETIVEVFQDDQTSAVLHVGSVHTGVSKD